MFGQVLATELIKLRRAKVTWVTLVGLSVGPLGIALFMWIVREPDRAAQLGLLGTKANLAGLEATWPMYLQMLTLIIGIGGMILLAFIVIHLFGREYEIATAKNMLALPVARHWFVIAKFVIALVWWVALVLIVIGEGLVVATLLDLPGYSAGLAMSGVGNALLAAGISFLLAPVVAWVTVATRSGAAAIGFAIGMLALGNLFGRTGWAEWFPWSIVPLLIGLVSDPVTTVPAGSYVVLALTFLAGIAATIFQTRFADLAQ